MSSKTVYFEIVNENEEELDYDDLANIFPDYKDEGLEVFELSVADIEVGFFPREGGNIGMFIKFTKVL